METINKINSSNIEIVRSIETKSNYNYDFLINQKTQLIAALNEVENILKNFDEKEIANERANT